MKHISLTITLCTLTMLTCLVGCYSTIPATDIEPIFSPCGIAKEIHKATRYETSSVVNEEQVKAGGVAFAVYLTDSVTYSYDCKNRLLQKQVDYYEGGHSKEIFSYSPGKMSSVITYSNKQGAITSQRSYSVGLNAQGFDNRYNYNAEGQRIKPDDRYGNRFETWENGNLTQESIGSDVLVLQLYKYDLTHVAMPNPRQFDGLGSRSLVVGRKFFPSVNGDTLQTDYTYRFDDKGHVKRIIEAHTVYKRDYHPVNKPAPNSVYVTDYEYTCP